MQDAEGSGGEGDVIGAKVSRAEKERMDCRCGQAEIGDRDGGGSYINVDATDQAIACIVALEGVDRIVGVNCAIVAGTEGAEALAKGDQLAAQVEEGAIPVFWGGKTAPTVGIMGSGESDFIAVVDAGRTGKGEH